MLLTAVNPSCRRSKACRHSAPDVDGRHGIQMFKARAALRSVKYRRTRSRISGAGFRSAYSRPGVKPVAPHLALALVRPAR